MQASLPSPQPTNSYWLKDVDPLLANYCSNEGKLPAYVQTVVIGSGISGALITDDLFRRLPAASDSSVLMLEARALCSGATGRNGGHIKPDCYRGFTEYKNLFNSGIARDQCMFEYHNLKETIRFIHDENLAKEVDLVETRSADVFMTANGWREVKRNLAAYREAGGETSMIKIFEGQEAQRLLRVKDCHGAITYPACSLWPHKLAVSLIKKSLARDLQLFTNTPVTKISKNGGNWVVHTPKGDIACSRVIHTTNGYASQLLPQLSGKLVPVKGHVVAIQPNASYQREPLTHTYGIHWGEDYDYLIQRPTDGKPLIFGGADLAHPQKLMGGLGDSDDSTLSTPVVQSLQKFPANYFAGWGELSSVRFAWSGIMGFTPDAIPYVGQLPGLPNQFIAAGFNGHGMARAFLTLKALGQIMHGEEIDQRVPQPYVDIEARLAKPIPDWRELLGETMSTEAKGTL